MNAAAAGHRRMHSDGHYQSGARKSGPKMPMPDEQDLANHSFLLTWIDDCEDYFLHHGSEFEDDSVTACNKYNPDLVLSLFSRDRLDLAFPAPCHGKGLTTVPLPILNTSEADSTCLDSRNALGSNE